MADQQYFATITSERSFRDKLNAEKWKRFKDLDYSSASRWDRGHLFACGVIRRPSQPSVLPLLAQRVSALSSPLPEEVVKFVDGPKQGDLNRSEHALVKEHGVLGLVWAALAAFRGNASRRSVYPPQEFQEEPYEAEESERRKRARRNTMQDEYVNSSELQVGSSSPLQPDSQGSSSVGYVDADTHASLIQLEDLTLRLLSSAIRYVLFFAPPQDRQELPVVVEFRDSKSRVEVSTPVLERRLVFADDAGLCLRQLINGVFHMTNNRVALVETKTRFRIENGIPIISDRCFAQMTCQALASRLADAEDGSSNDRYDGFP